MAGRLRQPDFRALFHETFGTKPRKVRYRLRYDSNLGHDELFLSSLIHDARFLRSEVSLRGSKLLLKLERDCWELGLLPGQGDNTLLLHHSLAVLRVAPVQEIDWTLSQGLLGGTQELSIGEIFRTRDGSGTIAIVGPGWRASILLGEGAPTVEVEDKTVPALWSEISENPTLAARFRATDGWV